MDKFLFDQLRTTVLDLLLRRGIESSICPSEVVRKICPENWRDHMDDMRCVARQMRSEGLIDITQKGIILTEDNWKGPIRLKLKREE